MSKKETILNFPPISQKGTQSFLNWYCFPFISSYFSKKVSILSSSYKCISIIFRQQWNNFNKKIVLVSCLRIYINNEPTFSSWHHWWTYPTYLHTSCSPVSCLTAAADSGNMPTLPGDSHSRSWCSIWRNVFTFFCTR